MRSRYLAAAGIAALAVPALAIADGIGPHSSWYDQHPHATGPHNDVSIVFHRKAGRADLHVANFCLGSVTGEGATFPENANALNVRVHRGRIAFAGPSIVYGNTGSHQVQMRFRATVTPRRATGTVRFPGTRCKKTIHFSSKLAQRTR